MPEQVRDSVTKYVKEEDGYLFKEGEQKGKPEGKPGTIVKFLKGGIPAAKQPASRFDLTEEFAEEPRKRIR